MGSIRSTAHKRKIGARSVRCWKCDRKNYMSFERAYLKKRSRMGGEMLMQIGRGRTKSCECVLRTLIRMDRSVTDVASVLFMAITGVNCTLYIGGISVLQG